MKKNTTWLAAALGAAAGLAAAGAAMAQGVTGTTYLSNMDPATLNTAPNATYSAWNGGATFTSLPTGLEVSAAAYGSLYYQIPSAEVQTLNPNDAFAVLTFTVNNTAANYVWVGTPFTLVDNTGAVGYGAYSGSGNGGNPSTVQWNGNVVTWTVPLNAAQLAAVQGGGDAIGGFNLQFDPAVISGPPLYDVTFNSLTLVPAPEPATCALAGLGVAAMLILRRRK